jgi:uncharacterized protein with GYD domain
MRKYITIFTYSSGSWARMIDSPGDRTKAVQHMLESLGGALECIYWELGTHDGYFIVDLPDSVSAEALIAAMTKTGAFKCVEGHELLTQQQLIATLALARDAAQVYEVPGQQA